MNFLMNLLTISAWLMVVGGFGLMVLRLIGAAVHSGDKLQQLQDQLKGVRRYFPIKVPFFVGLAGVVILVAKSMS